MTTKKKAPDYVGGSVLLTADADIGAQHPRVSIHRVVSDRDRGWEEDDPRVDIVVGSFGEGHVSRLHPTDKPLSGARITDMRLSDVDLLLDALAHALHVARHNRMVPPRLSEEEYFRRYDAQCALTESPEPHVKIRDEDDDLPGDEWKHPA